MKLLMCQCRMCKRGRKVPSIQASIRGRIKGHKAKARRMLRKGDYDSLPLAVAIGYTD